MGGSSGGGEQIIRYAPYIEAKHEVFLNTDQTYRDLIIDDSPYDGYVDVDFDAGFYGTGYTMSSFPALYDMFGKFMAGLDVEALWTQILNDVQDNSAVTNLVNSHRTLIDQDYEANVLPRIEEGLRDINAVMTSSFVKAKALAERANSAQLAEFTATLQYKLLGIASAVFDKHLSWNSNVVKSYLEVMRLAIMTKFDTDTANYSFALKDKMFPFTVLEQSRANLGALQGATSSQSGSEPSTGQKVLGGALSGAAAGSSISPGWGTLIGGIVGGIGGAIS